MSIRRFATGDTSRIEEGASTSDAVRLIPEGVAFAAPAILAACTSAQSPMEPAGNTLPRPRAGLARAIVAALFAAGLAACAGGPPEDDIGPPPGMETTSPAPAPESPPPTLEGKAPSGYVEMREVEIAYFGSAGGGKGTLTYQGQTYPFEIAGLGGGGIGVSTVDASGEVYNLTDVAQFPGAYGERRSGLVIGDASAGHLWLENNAGVVMHLQAKREGLMLSLGADAVDIRMEQ
jgi:hypothetical protein